MKLRLGEAQVKSVESDQKKIDLEKELEQSMEGKEPDVLILYEIMNCIVLNLFGIRMTAQ